MKSHLTTLLTATLLFVSCSSRAIEPVGHDPIPRQKAPLQVWGVIPASVRIYDVGRKVTIDGLGFEPGAQVFIGGIPCLSTKVNSNSNIKCRIPQVDEPGRYSVTVVNPDGTTAPLEIIPPREIVDDDEYPAVKWLDDGLIYLKYTTLHKEKTNEI